MESPKEKSESGDQKIEEIMAIIVQNLMKNLNLYLWSQEVGKWALSRIMPPVVTRNIDPDYRKWQNCRLWNP